MPWWTATEPAELAPIVTEVLVVVDDDDYYYYYCCYYYYYCYEWLASGC